MRRTLLLCSAVFVLAASTAVAQPVFDAQSSITDVLTAGAPTTTLAHTTAVTTNRILLVAVHMNVRNDTDTAVTGVTYAGTAMTLVNAAQDTNNDTRTELWYLLNPATGANNVIMTAGNIGAGVNVEALVSATTFSNVHQAAPSSITATGNGSPASATLTGTTTTDVVLDFVTARETVTLTAGGSQTAGYNTSTGGTNDDLQGAVSGRLGASGSTTMTWTLSATRRWSQIVVALQRASADVEIRKRATPDPVLAGGTLTYTIEVLNNGPSSATGVSVVDTLPGTVTFSNSSTTQGSCSGTGPVTCTIGTMASGGTATITINVTAPNTAGLIANNSATVSSTTNDTGSSNTATATAYVLAQATTCQTQPGKDGAGGTLAGTVNSYWPGTASAAAGATTITVGTRRGAAVSITAGDLLLIIQMQDAAMDGNNDDRYGSGVGITGGTTNAGSGYSNANNAGRYEYAIATNTIGAAGGNLTIASGLTYAYTNAAASATMGQRRFQVVRVPQYTSATLGATLTASAWNGTSGGILAFDVAGDLALGSTTVNVNGLGFRGGGPRQIAGGGTATSDDYRNTAAQNAHGIKGEGIAGTPEWVLDSGAALDTGPQGYPNGDYGRGAPGNAGGGGTDGNPSSNDQNSGGGGGANWGSGGRGGNTWNSNLTRGGFGGSPFYGSPGRVVLGGGGGAGSRNNSSGIASSGGAGGGIVLVRAGRLTGTGTITANGSAAYNLTANDGGGGGGAGGSIVVLSYGGGITGLTAQANGGAGGNAWSTQAPGGTPGDRHGPGGGGGGGYIALNGTPASTSVTGGAQGITTTANDTYSATAGVAGNVVITASHDQITGVDSGCTDLAITLSDSPDPVFAGNNLTYTQSITNNSTTVPAHNVTTSQTLPSGTTFVSMTPPANWSCTTPAVGGTGTVTCTYNGGPFAAGASSGNFTLVVATDQSLADGSSLSETVTVATSNPESATANNSDTEGTTVNRRVDIALTKTTNDDGSDDAFMEGETLEYTITVTNNGPSRATNIVVTDPLPAGFTFVSVSPGGPTCTHSSGTVTCTYSAMNNGAQNSIVITGTISTNTTTLTNTASSTRTETDTDSTNDSASVSVVVLAPTFVRMLTYGAAQDHDGKVSIQWSTSYEADNLGFNVYRQRDGAPREKLNKHLIAGSAFFTKRAELTSGSSYRWKDKLENGAFAQYWLEDVDLNGTRTMHGPFAPTLSNDPIGDEANTDTLADLGSNGGVLNSPRGIGAARAFETKPDLAQQWEISSKPAVKLMITEEGWYRVMKSALLAAGFDPGDLKKLSLFTEGVEQPMIVDGDVIEFYGAGLDTQSAGARAYWLVDHRGNALRMKRAHAKGKGTIASTPFTVSHVERSLFFAALVNNGENENFFGEIVWTGDTNININVDALAASGNATLEVVIQGATEIPHDVRVALNGTSLPNIRFAPQERKRATFPISASVLREGTNTLTLGAAADDFDISLVESVRITYPRKLVASDDALRVIAPAGSALNVSGFTTDRIRAIDVTNPAQPLALDELVAPESGERTILLVGEARVSEPAQIVPSRASSWHDAKNAADLVIITPRAFVPAAETLKTQRDREGIATAIVDVQDLYDEFGFGHRGPEAVRAFLQRTRAWSRAPRYVLLLGDATLDPRNYLGYGTFDFVPTRLISTRYTKTASDEWLAPDLAIGRLPARTLAQAQTMIAKVLERPASNNTATFIAENSDYDFAGAAQSLASLVRPDWSTSVGSSVDPAKFESQMLTYFGHGSVAFWNTGRFEPEAASRLTNRARPIVVALTCLNGYFIDPFVNSLAEALLMNANGGASAVWASTALTAAAGQVEPARELFRQLMSGQRLGDAARAAKNAATDPDVRRSWVLFGDPSMPLQ